MKEANCSFFHQIICAFRKEGFARLKGMELMKKLIITAICIFAAVLLAPVAVYASQTSRTLRPGNVYEFTGIDARVISHVNSPGTGRYEIVTWNSEGDITRFGTGTGRFSISGTGGAAISPLTAITVTFDSSRLRITSQAGTALEHVQVSAGQTVQIANSRNSNMHVRTSPASNFDFALFNRMGGSTNFMQDIRMPQMSIPAGGSLMLTAVDNQMGIYFPARMSSYITVENVGHPAIFTMELLAGQVYSISNTGNTVVNLPIVMPYEGAIFSFEYITRGRDGHVSGYGQRDTNTLQLASMNSISITPTMDGEFAFPYLWLENVSIQHGELTPRYMPITRGQSITVTNTDANRAHSVFVRCPDNENAFELEYVIQRGYEVIANTTTVFAGGSATINLQGVSQATITIIEADSHLAVHLPNADEITAAPSTAAAMARHRFGLQLGGITISNNHPHRTRTAVISCPQNSGFKLDVLTHHNESFTYNTHEILPGANLTLTLQSSAVATLTTLESAGTLEISFPNVDELAIQHTTQVAIVRMGFAPGRDSISFANNHPYRGRTITVSCPSNSRFTLDYTVTVDDEFRFNTVEILPGADFALNLRSGAVAAITALEYTGHLEARFPNVEDITATYIEDTAVVRHVLEPGQSLYISNAGEEAINLSLTTELLNSTAMLDYVRYYDRDIDSFGVAAPRAGLAFREGESALITNSSNENITVRVPHIYKENGLSITETDTVALYRRVIDGPTQIQNLDRRFTHEFAIINETRRNIAATASVLDFVQYTIRNDIMNFGQHHTCYVEVPAQQRMIIAPVPNGIEPTVIFPATWLGRYLRVTTVTEAPLHRITLQPGRRITIHNHSQNSFVIQNNSDNTAAGYSLVITPPRTHRRELLFECEITGQRQYRDIWEQIPINRGSNNHPLQGPIELAANTAIQITATPGANLELWLPMRQARALRLV